MFSRSKRILLLKKSSSKEVEAFVEKLVKAYGHSKADRIKLRLLASEVLRHLKPVLSYRDISVITGLPESVLCRYVKGSIIPSFEQAVKILAKVSLSIDLGSILKDLVERDKSPVIDLLRVLKDPYIVRLLSILIMLDIVDKDVTKIVATAESVLPVATMLSMEFRAPILLVKRKSYPGVQYYSVSVMKSPRDVETLYLDRDLISRKDRVLVLADVVYTGKTLESVLQMLAKSKAEIADVIAILGLGIQWKERLQPYNVKVLTIVPFEM